MILGWPSPAPLVLPSPPPPPPPQASLLGKEGGGVVGDGSANKVQLMTMHRAKGREFSHVFLAGWEEGVFPLIVDDLEEGGAAGLDAEAVEVGWGVGGKGCGGGRGSVECCPCRSPTCANKTLVESNPHSARSHPCIPTVVPPPGRRSHESCVRNSGLRGRGAPARVHGIDPRQVERCHHIRWPADGGRAVGAEGSQVSRQQKINIGMETYVGHGASDQ